MHTARRMSQISRKLDDWPMRVLVSRVWRGSVSHIDPHNVLLPVPHSVIEANTQGRVNQNVGYDGWQNNVTPIATIE